MFKFRYADASDAQILAEIHVNSWKAAYKGIVPDKILENMTVEKRQKYFEKALTEGLEETAIIFNDNKPVGMITIGNCRDTDKDSTYGEIWGIYLLPEHWNKGIGSQSVYWALKELKNKSYKKVALWVLQNNINARKFYEKLAFKHDGTVEEINLGTKLNKYRYERDIDQA